MLDVIGAGATATCTTDWNQVWRESPEAVELEQVIQRINREGCSRPVPCIESHPVFASSWMKQLGLLTRRGLVCYWRNPTYIYAKLLFCIVGGLSTGLTFLGATDSLLGCQAKLFVRVFCASPKCEEFADTPIVRPHLDYALWTISIAVAEQISRKSNCL